MAAAFAHLDDVERLGSESLQEAARLQRAVLCTRSGRVDEALEIFALHKQTIRFVFINWTSQKVT